MTPNTSGLPISPGEVPSALRLIALDQSDHLHLFKSALCAFALWLMEKPNLYKEWYLSL